MNTFTTSDFANMQQYFFSGATASYEFRHQQLQLLRKALKQYEPAINTALYKDLHKPIEESYATEIGFLHAEISHALKNLRQWMKPKHVNTPLALFPSSSKVVRESLGVCLVIAPWNYPIQLSIGPLIGAIAGGNCAVLKPSEFTTHTSQVMAEMFAEFFQSNYLRVVQGDGAVLVPQMMNENRFDHVFFTGSVPIGREIAKLAAPKLVPTTLELGGKSPCIVDEDVEIATAARRIAWGKFANAGQTCVAPDYVLVHEKTKDELVDGIKKNIRHFYGDDPQRSVDYGRIVNKRRFDALQQYLQQGRVIHGGKTDVLDLYIEPTLIDNVPMGSPLMSEEIFGPILPVITYTDRQQALSIVQQNPNPLSFYYFGNNRNTEQFYLDNVSFGGGCINNTLVHLANCELPFGGVGNSGTGAYHGKYSFETFTRAKGVLKTGTWLDPSIKYPPYKGKLKILKWFFR
jgi:aldehyde dehydrogenase (NAD+)